MIFHKEAVSLYWFKLRFWQRSGYGILWHEAILVNKLKLFFYLCITFLLICCIIENA